jgi:exopolyphosphatase / guanosine-5'-triphosphate,3'-diphosphate pyrophosphatase
MLTEIKSTRLSDIPGRMSLRATGSGDGMLLGVLDIGSNSAQLQVFEVRPGAPPLPKHAVKEPTLLGEAFDPGGAIDQAGIGRLISAVRRAMNAACPTG